MSDVNPSNLAFVEEQLEKYLVDPDSVDLEWREYFARGQSAGAGENGARIGPSFKPSSIFAASTRTNGAPVSSGAGIADCVKQEMVDQLIRAYRVRGHRIARLDPLGSEPAPFAELQLEHYGLTESDLNVKFSCKALGFEGLHPLQDILSRLRNTYCGTIGVQFMHIDDPTIKFWLQERMESTENKRKLPREEQLRILTRLTDAELFEGFLQKKFVGAKRFSLEGGESLIPLLDLMLEDAAEHGVDEVIIGMAHRGRINVLANIMQKDAGQIFREFSDKDPGIHFGRGDVKYHQGYASNWTTSTGKKVHLELCFNPSHLEFVGPVVLGRVRARQDRRSDRYKVMGLVIHGDAAFPGQGVVQEQLNMSEIPGYRVGGTLHVIVNNQIGFTTAPGQARSSTYPSDVAKMLQIPILHVNGEHPEAVAVAIHLAMEFREKFHKDVIIDMYCYRRHGHNEGDDPTFTQPVLYEHVRQRKSVREGYLESLLTLGEVTRAEADEIVVKRLEHLESELNKSRDPNFDYQFHLARGVWSQYRGGPDAAVPEVPTSLTREQIGKLLRQMVEFPGDFTPHAKIPKLLVESRLAMAEGQKPFDWATGEALAFASLLAGGAPVRLSGQDVGRGTFSHRHAILYDARTGRPYIPLQHVAQDQARFQVWDSPLTETAVLAFEYGFGLDYPESLVLWEAQFGDFCNVAQVIIDQFLVSSEDKWHRLSALVMLLPHGFEGQGPEHSSARLERFLTLAAEDNIQVVNITTPANYFHCLRRQVLRPWRKPLIVMSPKSLLRHPECTSSLEDFTKGAFQRVIPDQSKVDPETVTRILLCSGKLYYELVKARETRGAQDVAILRLEQYYPFPEGPLKQALGGYPRTAPLLWVQEEPANMGAATFLKTRVDHNLGHSFHTVSRPESASPATGSHESHRIEQEWLIEQAFTMPLT